MSRTSIRVQRRDRRKRGLRKRIFGTAQRPRLTVYRSLNHIYAQIIDDVQGKTLAAASSRDADCKTEKSGNKEGAVAVGKLLAQRAQQKGITDVQFDRNGLRFHGRIKAMADAAREGGLKF